jgi:hypothetical protein
LAHGFPRGILVYGFTKDHSAVGRPGRPAIAAIVLAFGCIAATVAGLTWMVTAKAKFLSGSYVNDVRHQRGLAISSNLAARRGGKLRLVKSDVGRSIFQLEMPISAPAPSQ